MIRIRFLLACVLLMPTYLLAQCLQPKLDLPEVNGLVTVIKPSQTGDTLFVGGNFTAVSPKITGSLALFSKNNLNFIDSLPVFGNTVNAIVSDGSGGWYVAGKFVKIYPGTDRYYIARIRENGSIHPFSLTVNGEIRTLQFTGDRLFIGGNFNQINSQSRNYIAAVDTNGNLLNWAPNLNNVVQKIVFAGTKVYVGGDFTTAGGLPRLRLAVFDTFNSVPNALSATINSTVFDIEVDDSLIYIGGLFTSVNGSTRNYLAALRQNSGSLHSFNASISGYVVNDILLYNNKLVLAGSFTSVGFQPRSALAAVNKLSGAVLGSNLNIAQTPTSPGTGYMLYKHQDKLFLGGYFSSINGTSRQNFAALDTGTFSLLTTQVAFNNPPLVIGSNNTNLLFGGSFSAIYTINKRGFFAYKLSTKEILDDGIQFTGTNVQINDINFYGNKLIFGGVFDSINSQFRKNLCMISFTGTVDPWNLPADNEVKNIEVYSQRIVVAGSFANIGGLARTKMAVLDATSSSVLNILFDPNGAVNDLTLLGNRLFVGGAFTQINGVAKSKLASYTISGNNIVIDTFSASIASMHSIKKLAYFNNRLYVLSDSLYGSYQYSTLFYLDTLIANNKPYKSLKAYKDYYLNALSITGYDSLIMLTYYYTNSLFNTYVVAIEPTGNEISPLLIGGYSDLYAKKIGERIYLYGNVNHLMNIYGNFINYLDLSVRPQVTLSKENFCTADTILVSSNISTGNRWQNNDTSNAYSFVVPVQNQVSFYTLAPMPSCSLSLSKVAYYTPWQQPALNTITFSKNPKCAEDTISLGLLYSVANGTNLLWSTNDTSGQISVMQAGQYQLKLSNQHCIRLLSPVQIANYAIPAAAKLISTDSFFHICADTQIVISVSGAAPPYYWSDSSTGYTNTVNKTGQYNLYYKDFHGCKSQLSNTISILADTIPEFPNIEFVSKATLCGATDSLEIKALVARPDSLFWSTGDKGKVNIYAKLANQEVYVQNRNGKCIRQSFPITLVDDKPSKPHISLSGPVGFCEGGSVTLTSDYVGSNKWSNLSTAKSLTTSKSGFYWVQALNNTCASDASDTVFVDVFSKPITPILVQVGDSLKASSNETLIWFKNGVQVFVGTQNYYLPNSSGSYTCQAKSVHLCISSLSNAITFYKTGIANLGAKNTSVLVYPNPAQNNVRVECSFPIDELVLFNSAGERVLETIGSNRSFLNLNLEEMPEGVYTLALKVDTHWQYSKLVKVLNQ